MAQPPGKKGVIKSSKDAGSPVAESGFMLRGNFHEILAIWREKFTPIRHACTCREIEIVLKLSSALIAPHAESILQIISR